MLACFRKITKKTKNTTREKTGATIRQSRPPREEESQQQSDDTPPPHHTPQIKDRFTHHRKRNLRVLDGPTSNKMETARLVTRFIKLQKACGWGGGETFQTALKSLNGLGLSHLASKHTSNKDSQFFVVCARRNINFFLSRMRRHSMLSFFLPFCIPKLPVVYVCPSRQRIQVRCERAASSR